MKLVYKGKTKDVYDLSPSSYKLVFSDRVTKNAAGQVDPGGNTVADKKIVGQGEACLRMSACLFTELQKNKICQTHMQGYDFDELSMTVRKLNLFKPGLEWIGRWVCTGSFLKRYSMIEGLYDGMALPNPVFETTLKDDAACDPLIVQSAISALGIVTEDALKELMETNIQTLNFIHKLFADRGLDLWDIKIEWALDENNKPVIIDEISPGSCRAFKKGSKDRVQGMDLAKYFKI